MIKIEYPFLRGVKAITRRSRNYESVGYWDFWQKQSQIPGQDCETICGLLDSIKGKVLRYLLGVIPYAALKDRENAS